VDFDLNLDYAAAMPRRADFGIGVVGAGFIMHNARCKAGHCLDRDRIASLEPA
jgi:hypothetical protein